MTNAGKYIVIEGSDGIGKTTQSRDMLIPKLESLNIDVKYVHEPGGTAMGEEIELLVKNRNLDRHPMTSLLLFTAARLESWDKIIKPALDSGAWVVADRNWLSSVVYQGYAGGLGAKLVYDITRQTLPEGYMYPDLTVLARASTEQQLKLLKDRGKSHEDFFESQKTSFQEALRSGYDNLMSEPLVRASQKSSDFKVVSFDGSIDTVHQEVLKAMTNLLTSNS